MEQPMRLTTIRGARRVAAWGLSLALSLAACAGPDAGEPVDFFALLRERDVLVHHPYDSFESSFQAFLEQAASDTEGYDVVAMVIHNYTLPWLREWLESDSQTGSLTGLESDIGRMNGTVCENCDSTEDVVMTNEDGEPDPDGALPLCWRCREIAQR